MGAPGYYRATIVGMPEWCDAFARVAGTVPAIQKYVNNNEIRGVTAPDDSTLVITLQQPTPDFLHLLLMAFCSPWPVEYPEASIDSLAARRACAAETKETCTSLLMYSV